MVPTLPLRVLLLGAALVLSACTASHSASFDANAPCPAEGRFGGAYPDLEALVPRAYRGEPPQTLDSGRNCTAANLGSLASLGVNEVRFAGGTWSFGGERALVMAVFRGEGLDAGKLAAFYASSAGAAPRTTITGQTTPMVAGRPGHRLDTTTSERTQTVVTWPSASPNMVNVVITNDLPDARIQDAIDAFGGR